MAETYKPKMSTDKIVKFTRAQLEDLLDRLEESGAQEIGVDLERA